jgi:hypothetical protein
MTPKEKAEELFDKFMKPIDELHKYPMCFSTAKQCALIAVDELEKQEAKLLGYNPDRYSSEYWQEVKQEIEKL